jgi:prepilin-type N-terminal cleavage/methylation domain-containing protein
MERTLRAQQGFTLIEVMVAMVVLSLALFELGRLQIVSLQTTSNANRLARATTIAQDRAEQLLALAYDAPLLNDGTSVGQVTSYSDPNPPTSYTVTWDVDSDVPVTDTKTVNVRVRWRDLGRLKTFTISLQKGRI